MDVEPRHAQAAFALFGAPGTPMALAALKINGAAREDEPARPETARTPSDAAPPLKEGPKRTTGPICQWLVMRAKEPEFREWLTLRGDFAGPLDEAGAAQVQRDWCSVESRAEIDGNRKAEALWKVHFQEPWAAFNKRAARV